jgi:5-formyltetrahydrofolate cyclo-ligase
MPCTAAHSMTDTTKNAKIALRTRMRGVLTDLDQASAHLASLRACERLTALDPFRSAQIVMLYMPLPMEVDLTTIALRCFQSGKTICVPRVDWEKRDMVPVEVTTFDDRMAPDAHGVRSPREGRPISPLLIDLIVVPGLAFDAAGRRIGRGGGYYDRFLARLRPDTFKVGLAFDEQIVDEVPVDDWDVNVDSVVTDRRVTRSNATRLRD